MPSKAYGKDRKLKNACKERERVDKERETRDLNNERGQDGGEVPRSRFKQGESL